MAIQVGDTVRVVGFPDRYPWMEDFVGDRGVVAEVNKKHTAYGVRGLLPDGDLAWLVPGHLEPSRQRKSA